MRLSFAEAAIIELNDAVAWYEHQQAGLGKRFRGDVREASLRIAVSPLLFPVELEDVRRCVMTGFPYTLRFVVRGDEIWVVALSHQHRRPDYWVERTKNQ
jgi:hypothetical protein